MVQQPIYFTNYLLKDVEVRCSTLEKLALALVLIDHWLRPYFLSHPITVLISSTLRHVLANLEVSGRLIKGTIELSKYNIQYQPQITIKAYALVDFLTNTSGGEGEEV